LTAAIESAREGLLRQVEGMVGKTRGEVLGSLSAETGGIKESVWEEISRIRGRLDDCENLLVNSNEEIVGILNKKCYKADVVAALGTKADKNVVLNSLRLKADSQKVDSDKETYLGSIASNNSHIANISREFYELKDDTGKMLGRMEQKMKLKADVDEIEALKIGVGDGRDWRSSISDMSLNLR
tara:strand:- start:516 stop:1067 length:552 start_codon:yes stop_codon:yes gene_type:complete